MRVCLVLLAAGLSRRFGAENKLLYPWEGKPLYRHTLDKLLAVREKHTDVLVMTNTPEVQRYCEEQNVRWLASPNAAEGVSHTIRAAVAGAGDADACVFFVADQPRMKQTTIQNFLRFCVERETELACVAAGGHRGSPVWFGRRCFPALSALTGDVGGRTILSQHSKQVLLFLAEQAELTDIDRPPCEV